MTFTCSRFLHSKSDDVRVDVALERVVEEVPLLTLENADDASMAFYW
jgi:hypothetical protein